LQAHLEGNRLQLHTHFFWTSPLACWDMPADLASDLRLSALLISKGDANYRRLIGDRHWPDTLDFAQALHYAPAPLLALRVSKSEPVVGLCEGQAAALDQVDAHWRTNGRWGMIQFTASSSLVPTNAGCRG
jgi:hypothetical protein